MPNYPENSRQQPMFTRHPFGEPKWQLQSQSEFDGLAPSQIVRYLNAGDRGFEDSEVQGKLAARLDATPDADNYVTNPAAEGEAKGVTVDAHRYVVDPIVDNDHHQYVGLYTGGPVRTTNEPSREGGGFHKRCTQVLTRTFCAGHGYWVDEAGRYHAAWPDGNGGWTGRNPDVKQVVFKRPSEAASEDSDVPPEGAVIREYMTADDALKAHRPALDSKLSPYMALHPESFPNTFVREVYWREFTHESIAALEELGSDRTRLEAVVAYHFTQKVAPQVLDAHCRLDPQTNTVVFVCSLMYVDLGEPESPDDLIDLPCLVAPCTRETLRMFGWNQLRDGEGYKYTHVFRWPRLVDSKKTRRAIEFVKDNKAVAATDNHPAASSWILALLAKHDPPATGSTEPPGYAGYETLKEAPVLDAGPHADNTGRLTAPLSVPRNATVGSGDPLVASTTSPAQFYRIAQQQVQVEQDGSLSFSIALVRTEWHGADSGTNYEDGGTRQLAGKSNPMGWGVAETRVIPSVPRENAIPTMLGIKASTLKIITGLRQTEGNEGHSDVSFEEGELYNYSTKIPENTYNLLADARATSQSYNPYPRPTYSLTYERVDPLSVGTLITHIKSVLGGDPAISVVYHPGGYYTVSARGTGKTPRHIREWIVSADWYHHETVEQWLGVTVDDAASGFYSEYNDDGTPKQASLISFASVRGDLDANWMGSDPSTDTTIEATTGIGVNSHSALNPQPSHGDAHGEGWTAGSWTDPDTDEGNAGGPNDATNTGDTPDKARSHVITSVRPHVNEDGTWNFYIQRNYPHQRVHYWETRQEKEKGDWRPVYHAEYHNWPSRKAIFKDLVKRLADRIGADVTGDDYTWGFNPNVNVHGLVDAADVTIAPVVWNKKSGSNPAEDADDQILDSSTYHWVRTYNRPARARTDPAAADQIPAYHPLLGFYFAVCKHGRYDGSYQADHGTEAIEAYNAIEQKTAESVPPKFNGKRWVWTAICSPVRSKIIYNGDMPTPEDAGVENAEPGEGGVTKQDLQTTFHGQSVGQGDTLKGGVSYLSKKTWQYWFEGKQTP